MRKTRPHDYDPTYKEHRSPEPDAVNVEGIVPIKKRVLANDEEPAQSEPPERSQPRVIRRRSFDIYIDQYNRLIELKKEAMYRGEERGLAKMVREALDDYLAKEK